MGLQPLNGARRQHDHAMGSFAAQNLLPGPGCDIQLVPGQGHGKGRRGRITDRQSTAVLGDPIRIGDAHPTGRAVPGENDVPVLCCLGQVR